VVGSPSLEKGPKTLRIVSGPGLSRRPGGVGDKTEQDLIRGDNSNEIEPDSIIWGSTIGE